MCDNTSKPAPSARPARWKTSAVMTAMAMAATHAPGSVCVSGPMPSPGIMLPSTSCRSGSMEANSSHSKCPMPAPLGPGCSDTCRTLAAQCPPVGMHLVHQHAHVFGIDLGRDAVAEIEHVTGMIAVAVQHGAGFAADYLGAGAQDRGIEVALQRHLAGHRAARVGEVDGPVHAQRGAAGVGHR